MVENKMVPVQETRYDINLFQIRLWWRGISPNQVKTTFYTPWIICHQRKYTGYFRGSFAINENIPYCYTQKLSISDMKKRDLLSLCSEGIIPSDCHGFYHSLPSNCIYKDILPVPNQTEDDKDSEIEWFSDFHQDEDSLSEYLYIMSLIWFFQGIILNYFCYAKMT